MKKMIIIILSLFISFNSYADSLSRAISSKMDYLIARQGVISGNISNASTPNYLAKDIKFKPQRNSSSGMKMKVTSSKHIGFNSRSVVKYEQLEDKTFIRNDGNSVRIDEQMLKLANIQQEYDLATKLYSKHMSMQKLAVQAK